MVLSCVAWRFFREHYSFVGSTTERLAAKTRANERQSPCGFPVLASPQTSFGVRSSRIHFSPAGRLPLPSSPRASPAFINYFSRSTKTAKLRRLEKTSAAWKRFKGITLQPWARWLFLSRGFSVFRRTLPTVDFSLRGGGVGGVITQANPSRSLRAWRIPTWQMNCLSMNLL